MWNHKTCTLQLCTRCLKTREKCSYTSSQVRNALPQSEAKTAANIHHLHRCCYCIIDNVASCCKWKIQMKLVKPLKTEAQPIEWSCREGLINKIKTSFRSWTKTTLCQKTEHEEKRNSPACLTKCVWLYVTTIWNDVWQFFDLTYSGLQIFNNFKKVGGEGHSVLCCVYMSAIKCCRQMYTLSLFHL